MNRGLLAAFLALLVSCGDSGEGSSAPAGTSGGKNPGPDPFNDAVLTTFEIDMSAQDWNQMSSDLQDNTWRHATVRWQGEVYPDVAIHPAGQSSRKPGIANPDKPSMWLNFDEFVPGREFHKYERVKLDSLLDDPSMIRERLTYAIYAARGVPAPKSVHCRVVVNGVYRGIYLLEERVNKEFCTKRFGPTPVNQLYRWTEAETDTHWDPNATPQFYVPNMWEPRIESSPPAPEDVQLMNRLVNTDPHNAGAAFDVESFINFMAVEVATGETDGYIGWNPSEPAVFYTGNIFMYKAPATGLLTWIVWDRDQSFWRETPMFHGFDQRIMTRKLILENPANQSRFRAVLKELLDGPTHPATLKPRMNFIIDQIRKDALADPYHRTPTPLESEWGDVERHIDRRHAQLLTEL